MLALVVVIFANAISADAMSIGVYGEKTEQQRSSPLFRVPKRQHIPGVEIRKYMSSVWIMTKPTCANDNYFASVIDIIQLYHFAKKIGKSKRKSFQMTMPFVRKFEYQGGNPKCKIKAQEMMFIPKAFGESSQPIPTKTQMSIAEVPFSTVYVKKYFAAITDTRACAEQWNKLIDKLNKHGEYFRSDVYFCAKYDLQNATKAHFELWVPAITLEPRR